MAMMEDEMAELWFEQQYAADLEAMEEAEHSGAAAQPRRPTVAEADDDEQVRVPSLSDFAKTASAAAAVDAATSERMREIMGRMNEFSDNASPGKRSDELPQQAFKRPASKHVGFLEEPFAAAGFGGKIASISARGVLLDRPELGADHATCVLANGALCYLRYKAKPEKLSKQKLQGGRLLHHSMQELQRIAERELVRRKTMAALQPLSHEAEGAGGKREKLLWVEKYAPKSFSQLLSHEKTNREVLKAVKEWDSFVFKTPVPKFAANEKLLQEDGRPVTKVILLCGPPGTGKTTLAHVVVKHAGYRPVELNASDDRSAAALKETLERAMNGRSVVGEPKPNAIILDEIDGIDGRGAIDALLQIVKAPLKTKGAKAATCPLTRPLICICNDQYAPQLRELRKHARIFQFQRVNDNRLTQRLRAICVTENLSVNSSALAALAAASASDIRSSINTMQLAAARYQEEVRKHGSKAQPLSSTLLAAVQAGLKDEERDIFQMWQCVFRGLPASSKSAFFPQEQQLQQEVPSASSNPLSTIMDMGSSFSEIDVLTAGLHENFLLVPFNDPTMRKISSIYHWLEFMDLSRTFLFEQGSASAFGVLAGAMHLLCNVTTRVRLQLPSKDRDYFYSRTQHESIVQSYREGRSLRSTGTPSEVAVQMVPHLLRIISPTVRHVPVEVMNDHEKATINHLVEVMLSCGLTFRVSETTAFSRGPHSERKRGEQTSSAADEDSENIAAHAKLPAVGGPTRLWSLEPALDQLVKFGGSDEGGLASEATPQAPKLVSQELREWLSHEVELASIRRNDAAATRDQPHMGTAVNTPLKASPTRTGNTPSKSSPLEELAKRPGAKMLDIESPQSKRARNALGFLANFKPPKRRQKMELEPAAAQESQTVETAEQERGDGPAGKRARIRFNKGFTNAVRRPASMSDFLPAATR